MNVLQAQPEPTLPHQRRENLCEQSKMGRPRGSHCRADMTAAEARRWWRLDRAGRLVWRQSPGGGVATGAVAGASVTLAGQKYRSNRVAVLLATGAFPPAGRVPIDLAAAVAGKPVLYRVPTPMAGMLRLIREVLGLEQVPGKPVF